MQHHSLPLVAASAFAAGLALSGLLGALRRRRRRAGRGARQAPASGRPGDEEDADAGSYDPSGLPHGLSKRGCRALTPILPYLGAHLDAALTRPYDKETRPDGLISMAVAENKLAYRSSGLPGRVAEGILDDDGELANYNDMRGRERFRAAIAGVMNAFVIEGRHLPEGSPAQPPPGLRVDAEDLVAGAGVSPLLHHLGMMLFERGDALLCVGPFYPAFDYDFVVQAMVEVLPVVLPHPQYRLTRAALAAGFADARGRGLRVRGVLITTPTNPSGQMLSLEELRSAIAFCEERELHLISDEVYALSVHARGAAHRSVAHALRELGREGLGDRVHVLWGLSKDLCMSGARVGVLWTQNASLKAALGNVSALTSVSSFAQYALCPLLEDGAFVARFIRHNQEQLRAAYEAVTAALGDLPFTAAQAGMFVWVDMRRLLLAPATDTEEDWQAEEELTRALIDVAGLVCTPGRPCHAPYPGFYRICFAWNDAEVTDVAMRRLAAFVRHRQEEIRTMAPFRRRHDFKSPRQP